MSIDKRKLTCTQMEILADFYWQEVNRRIRKSEEKIYKLYQEHLDKLNTITDEKGYFSEKD